jgi:hypothetical protein
MKDEITIGLNGKTIASFGIDVLKGITPIGVKSVSGFKTSSGVRDNGESVLEIGLICVLEKNCPADYVEEKKPVVDEKKRITLNEMMTVPLFTPAKEESKPPTYNEIPIKTGKKMGRPKKEDIVKAVEKIEKEGEFIPLEDVAKGLKIEVPVATPAVVIPPIKPPITFAPTNVRIEELGKLIKMWCKMSALTIADVTVALLKERAFDIVENDSDEAIELGMKEAGRLMGA